MPGFGRNTLVVEWSRQAVEYHRQAVATGCVALAGVDVQVLGPSEDQPGNLWCAISMTNGQFAEVATEWLENSGTLDMWHLLKGKFGITAAMWLEGLGIEVEG